METKNIVVNPQDEYFHNIPLTPKRGQLYASIDEDGGYIKVAVYDGKEWFDVTDMSVMEDGNISVSYSVDDEEPEDIEMMEYHYRMGLSL